MLLLLCFQFMLPVDFFVSLVELFGNINHIIHVLLFCRISVCTEFMNGKFQNVFAIELINFALKFPLVHPLSFLNR